MNEWRDALRELLQAVANRIQSGNPLPRELKIALAQLMERVAERIDQEGMQGQGGPQIPPIPNEQPQLEPGPFPSSNVNAFRYDPTTGTLLVKFHGRETADSGPTYRYENVPRNIYDVFSQGRVAPRTSGQNRYHRWVRGVTPSLGASLYALIREGGYPYQRVA